MGIISREKLQKSFRRLIGLEKCQFEVRTLERPRPIEISELYRGPIVPLNQKTNILKQMKGQLFSSLFWEIFAWKPQTITVAYIYGIAQ